jgi:hypothetical protein
MAKTRTEKIASYEEQIKQLEAQRKQLIQKEKEQERKDRTKRLCRRMGLIESLLPDTIPLSEEQFKTFLEKTVTTEQSRRILDGLTTQGNTAPAAKTAVTAQQSGESEDTDEGNGTRVQA